MVNVAQGLAAIQKGQQLAGHFPTDEMLDRARRVLSGELSPDEAEAEMNDALSRIVARENGATRNC